MSRPCTSSSRRAFASMATSTTKVVTAKYLRLIFKMPSGSVIVSVTTVSLATQLQVSTTLLEYGPSICKRGPRSLIPLYVVGRTGPIGCYIYKWCCRLKEIEKYNFIFITTFVFSWFPTETKKKGGACCFIYSRKTKLFVDRFFIISPSFHPVLSLSLKKSTQGRFGF